MAEAPGLEESLSASLYVLPHLALNDQANGGVGDAKFSPQMTLLSVRPRVPRADGENVCICQARTWVRRAARNGASPLFDHVGNVVGFRSQEQMPPPWQRDAAHNIDTLFIGTDTPRFVASMQNIKMASRGFASCNLPRNSVRQPTAVFARSSNEAIPVSIANACPLPASGSALDIGPESVGEHEPSMATLLASLPSFPRLALKNLAAVDTSTVQSLSARAICAGLGAVTSGIGRNAIRPRVERGTACFTNARNGRLTGHQAYSWCHTPGAGNTPGSLRVNCTRLRRVASRKDGA